MTTRPRFFLLDAGPVIELHRVGLWEAVVDRCEVLVPSVVAHRESQYWVRDDGSRPSINIVKDADAGRLRLLECGQEDLRSTFDLFDLPTQQSVDPGELHALTAIRMWPDDERPRFCCADRVAVVCFCLLGFSSLAVALEALLAEAGLTCPLHSRFSRAALADWVREGKERRLRGQGLATGVPG